MSKITYIEGDLFAHVPAKTKKVGVFIPHVCNDQGAWGSGFVVPLGEKFPAAKQSYLTWQKVNADMPFEQGNTQFVMGSSEKGKPPIIICNMVAQTLGGVRPLNYIHLAKCMVQVRERLIAARSDGATPYEIHAPMFGSGLAGGDWNFIEQMIEDAWGDLAPVTVHYLTKFLPKNWTPPKSS